MFLCTMFRIQFRFSKHIFFAMFHFFCRSIDAVRGHYNNRQTAHYSYKTNHCKTSITRWYDSVSVSLSLFQEILKVFPCIRTLIFAFEMRNMKLFLCSKPNNWWHIWTEKMKPKRKERKKKQQQQQPTNEIAMVQWNGMKVIGTN